MRHLDKVKPTGRGLAAALPEKVGGGAVYFPINANIYTHYEEFLGTAIDTDEWADASSLGTGGAAAITFASSVAILDTSTGTAGTASLRLRSAMTAGSNMYSVPFRVTYWARISTTAGAGVAPSNITTSVSCLYAYLGIQSTDDTHIARFNLDLSTAASTSLASPVVNVETRCGSTASAFINSAAHTLFSTAANVSRTATGFYGYTIEVTHRGVSFGFIEDKHANTPPQLLSYFGGQVPRIDQVYYLDMRIVADGTGGYTQTDGVQLEIDSVTVEQMAPVAQPMALAAEGISQVGAVKSFFATQAQPSSGTLATSGSGLFHGCGFGSSATGGTNLWIGVFDASAAGSAVYDFSAGNSTAAKLIWYHQIGNTNSADAEIGNNSTCHPPIPIPFYRGLVVGSVTVAGTAVGSSALNILTLYTSQR